MICAVVFCDLIIFTENACVHELCEAGTNDKAGSPYYIQRFVNLQAVKTQFEPLRHWSYGKPK